ncbi:hypothetical protein [Spongiactinospora sp. TRM90649]|uniref:hypothetical protein n=1 Tax=Spongiactinospora sp. TRM90649 TaxID=3031114 RepID=UPI0023F90CD8|nr:hypothetical protein [Spongiactinospora sp. TRM90649]MDF5751055.1 hypothetical protein [Spongiactinospora sp. TRM90649]
MLAAALIMIVGQLAWRGMLLGDAYFFGDDLTLTGRAAASGLTLDYLTTVHAVHVMPVGLAVVWAVTALDAYNWTLAAGSLLLLQAGASLAVLRMLVVLFGARVGVLAPLAVYLCAPLTLPAFHWWAAGVQAVPFQAAIAMAVASHVMYLRERRPADAVKTAAWFLLGLGSFHVKAAVAIPLVLLAVTVLYAGPRFGLSGGGVREALRRVAPAFAAYLGLAAAYSALLLPQLGDLTQTASVPAPGQIAAFAAQLLGVTFPALAVGGPGTWFSVMAAPTTAVIVPAWTAIAVIVAATLYLRRGAWRAWLTLLLYLPLVDVLPVILGRGEFISLAREGRYLADAAPVLALCLALATLPLLGESRPYRRAAPPFVAHVAAVVAVVLLAGFSVVSAGRYADGLAAERVEVRDYLAAARRTLAAAPPGTDVYPQRLPQDVLVFGLIDDDLSSRTLSPLAPPGLAGLMRNPRPSAAPMILNERARGLVLADVAGAIAWPQTAGGCFRQDGGVIDVPMAVRDGFQVLRLNYRADVPTAAYVRAGRQETEIVFERGGGAVYVPMDGRGRSVRVEILSPGTKVCVGAAALGRMVAR